MFSNTPGFRNKQPAKNASMPPISKLPYSYRKVELFIDFDKVERVAEPMTEKTSAVI